MSQNHQTADGIPGRDQLDNPAGSNGRLQSTVVIASRRLIWSDGYRSVKTREQ